MSFFSVLSENYKNFSHDCKVYWAKRGTHSLLYSMLYVMTCHGWHTMFLFRLGKVIYAIPIPIISHIIKIIYRLVCFFVSTFYGISINPISNIGKGFYIGHFGAIQIRGDFGDYCSVSQGVTVGSKGAGKSDGWPVFGDEVYIGAGAKILGTINIGNNVVIGANAVVTKDVASDSIALGIPARVRPLTL
jgi:serine O-acetyltransferase